MSNQRIGNLFYDAEIGRYDIRFGMDEYYGGLHCGECFAAMIDGEWVPTRIEMGEKWYLIEIPDPLDGLTVRI